MEEVRTEPLFEELSFTSSDALPPSQDAIRSSVPQNASFTSQNASCVEGHPEASLQNLPKSVPKRKRNNTEMSDVDNVFSKAVVAFTKLCEFKQQKERDEEKTHFKVLGK